MTTEIKADSVTAYEITPDGSRFRLDLKSPSGEDASVTLPTECLSQLVMTMPCIAEEALRRRYGDRPMRIAYPLDKWSLAATESNTHLILTLGTAEGFRIAFAIAPEDMAQITDTIDSHLETLEPAPAAVN